MDKDKVSSIIKRLPNDMSRHASRDLCVLVSAIFGKTHTDTMPRIFRVNFSTTFWCMKKGKQIILYRSEKEYKRFSEMLGKRCRDIQFAKKIANTLIKKTDWIYDFIKNHKNLNDFLEDNQSFFTNYRDYFGYHQAVYWAGDYLANQRWSGATKSKIEKNIKLLRQAYKYNELVVPKVEKYFSKLKIDHLLPEEVDIDVRHNIENKPKVRSILYLRKRRIILLPKKANKLEQAILERFSKRIKKIKTIRGICAQPGNYRGRVRLIKNLYKLKQCQSGEVLVTLMTRPQFNSVLKKVGAIITDEGGILSHAAILARESKIPCIVGTKIATEVLKNGDRVEVNATKRVIRKI